MIEKGKISYIGPILRGAVVQKGVLGIFMRGAFLFSWVLYGLRGEAFRLKLSILKRAKATFLIIGATSYGHDDFYDQSWSHFSTISGHFSSFVVNF